MGLNVFLFFSCLSLGVALRVDISIMGDNSTTQCQAILMQTETANQLNQYLDMTLVKGQKTLDKVLSSFGLVSRSLEVKADPGEPLESFLLQTLLSMHRDTMESFARMQRHLDNMDTSANLAKRPSDCWDILNAGRSESGIYEIYPSRCRCSKPVRVFCDMKTDGGGWTVFLLRDNASKHINFTRDWEDYKNGFGDPEQEYWLGNEHLHELTSNRNYTLRMEARNGSGSEVWGQWNAFSVDSEQNKYKLISTKVDPKSPAYDVFKNHTNMFFSTFDRDNDKWSKGNCAESFKAGWWYKDCYLINPTGDHNKDCNEITWNGPCLHQWSKIDSVIRKAVWIQLKIRPSQ